jgi:hypothetical protein
MKAPVPTANEPVASKYSAASERLRLKMGVGDT